MAQQQLLLLSDVDDLGRSGDIVTVRPGFARNFLLPKKKAVVADKFTLRLQTKLKEQRSVQAAEDKKLSEELAARINGQEFTISVKVDPEGHLYGSVSGSDIANLINSQGFNIEKKQVALPHPIKALGTFEVALKLPEGVLASVNLQVVSET